jgi:hypothetical protein
MIPPFFITGLPRTRSAWLANLFTTSTSLCFHEPQETAAQLQAQNPGWRIGLADSTLAIKFAELSKEFPDAPWLLVEREAKEAKRSFLKFVGAHVHLPAGALDYYFDTHAKASAALRAWPKALVVPYYQIDEQAEKIWNHLLPGVPYCRARMAVLRDLKVEQNFSKVYRERTGR